MSVYGVRGGGKWRKEAKCKTNNTTGAAIDSHQHWASVSEKQRKMEVGVPRPPRGRQLLSLPITALED